MYVFTHDLDITEAVFMYSELNVMHTMLAIPRFDKISVALFKILKICPQMFP